ncbi:helix-turn-helix transcriptional regulator [Streptomyces spiralis]|uniref:helix-turn-helix transcriptional regulator n=1 Tax=Streptomyces spiralis TaxID=66376 RepID=UPI0036765279
MTRGVTGFNGAALRAARRAAPCPDHPHTLTASCLARQIGTSKALVLSYESGRSSPSPQRLADLARAVGVNASELQLNPLELSDLRTSRGLTISALADQLGLAVNTYRQIETRGVLPRRRPGVFWDLTRVLDVSATELHWAIRQIPAVCQRRDRADILLKRVLDGARSPGPFKPLQDTSEAAIELAAVYGVAPSAVSKVVNLLLMSLRQLALQHAQLMASRDYAAHSKTQVYSEELDRIAIRVKDELASVPDILERYLVNPMPQPCWHSLAKLYLAGPSGLHPSTMSKEIITALAKSFHGYLLDVPPSGIGLSTPGVLFFLDTLPYYRVIYAPPERVIRPDPQFYGWPSFRARFGLRRHRLRTAHVLGLDPHPHWDGGSWMTIRPTRPTGSATRDALNAAALVGSNPDESLF